jgi:hypothetical protein
METRKESMVDGKSRFLAALGMTILEGVVDHKA